MVRDGPMTSQAEWARGSTRPATAPTGRLVSPPRRKGVAEEVSHWCPDAVKADVISWRCPECDAEFEWLAGRWRQVGGS